MVWRLLPIDLRCRTSAGASRKVPGSALYRGSDFRSRRGRHDADRWRTSDRRTSNDREPAARAGRAGDDPGSDGGGARVIIAHLYLSAMFGLFYGVYNSALTMPTRRSLPREAVIGMLYGALLWLVNFHVFAPLRAPWFLVLPPVACWCCTRCRTASHSACSTRPRSATWF